MNSRKLLSFCTLVLPWLTLPLIGKNTFIRFLPTATFIGYAFSLFSEVADKKKYWKVKNALFPNYALDFSFLIGLFFMTTIWVFKLTYGNFRKYLLLNIVADYIFSFHIVKIFTKVGVFEFKKMRPNHFFIISVGYAIVIYFYQKIIEKVIVKETEV